VLIIWEVIVANHSKLPAVDASYMATQSTVPQFAVGVANVSVPLLLIWPGDEGEPEIVDQPDDAMATRAYDPPLTSTDPAPELSVGAVVSNATYVLAGAAENVVPLCQFSTAFCRYCDILPVKAISVISLC